MEPTGLEAEMAVRRALWDRLEADPDGYETNRDFGLYCIQWRNLILLAEPYLLKALARCPDDEEHEHLSAALAEVYKMAGRIEDASGIYAELAARKPGTVNHHFYLGDSLFAGGDLTGASVAYGNGAAVLEANALACAERDGADRRMLLPYRPIHRYFGETAHKLDLFVKARALGLIGDFEAVVLAPDNSTANPPLMACFAPYVTLVTDADEVDRLTENQADRAWFFVDALPIPAGPTVHREMAYGVVQRLWSDEGRPPVIALPDDVRAFGEAWLRTNGVPEDAWFATIHVREAGYYIEDVAWNHNKFRNANMADHLSAIEAVTARGGWVVRLGDPSMSPLPPMAGVIDYAHREDRDRRLDVFLIARSRFLIGLSSGPMNVARAFGVPVAAVNYFPAGAWPFSGHDVFIHKLHRSVTDGRYLSMREALAPPLFAAFSPMTYEDRGVEVVDNDAEDIRDAVEEMMDRLDGRYVVSEADIVRQRRYRQVADPYGLGFLLPVANRFLERHPHLLA